MSFHPQIIYCHGDISEKKEDRNIYESLQETDKFIEKENKASDYFPQRLNLCLHFICWPTWTTKLLLKQHDHDVENGQIGSERDDFKSEW